MKTGCMAGKIVVCAALALVLGGGAALAQARAGKGIPVNAGKSGLSGAGGVVRIRQLTGVGPRALMKSPDSSGNRHGISREWVELGIQFDSEPDWLDEMSVQFFVLLKSRDTAEFTLLKGTVNYVDVVRGRGHLGCAYVRPAALIRYGDVMGVAVEITTKGEVVASLSEGKLSPGKPLPQDWWKNEKLVPKEGYVVDKSKTPFALVNFDDYEALK
jgi:hypothetical protein